jgi:hypothetical protein
VIKISNIKKSIDHLFKIISIMVTTLSTFVRRYLIEVEKIGGLVPSITGQIPGDPGVNNRVSCSAEIKLMPQLNFYDGDDYGYDCAALCNAKVTRLFPAKTQTIFKLKFMNQF